MASLVRNTALMGVSIGARLLAGVGVFILLARQLGPVDFGEFSFWLAAGGVVALPVTFGFNQYVLRAIPRDAARASQIVSGIGAAKARLLFLSVLAASVACLWITPEQAALFAVALGIAVADSYSEYWFALRRALGSYQIEAVAVAIHSLIHVSIFATGYLFRLGLIEAILLFLLSRILLAVIAAVAARRLVRSALALTGVGAREQIVGSAAFAIDTMLSTAYTQVDTVLVRLLLGVEAVGLYSAAIRFNQAASQVAVVLSNVFVPRLSKIWAPETDEFAREGGRTALVFVVTGLLLAGGVTFLADPLTKILFGSSYAALVELLPLVGFVIIVRYLCAALGIVLTAAGKQFNRAMVTAISLLLFMALAAIFAPRMGVSGVFVAHILVFLSVFLVYGAMSRGILWVSRAIDP